MAQPLPSAAVAGLLCLGLTMWRRPGLREKGWAILLVLATTIVASGVVIVAEDRFGGEHGSVTERVPVSHELQQWLGVIERKLDQIADTQQTQLTVASRQTEKLDEIRRLVDPTGGAAASMHAIDALRDLLRPDIPDIDKVPAEQLVPTVRRILEDARKLAARAEDFSGAVRDALEQAQVAQLQFADAQRGLDAVLAQAVAEDQTHARGRAALETLGKRESGTERQEQAVEAHRAALQVRTRERMPLGWAMTQNNLGNALVALAEHVHDRARLKEALGCIRNAAEMYREAGNTYWLPVIERRIGEIEAQLAAMRR